MKITPRFLRSSLLMKVLLMLLVSSLYWTPQLKAQQNPNPLRDKVQAMINKGKDIRLKLVSIASKGQGIPGWDRFSNAVDHLSLTISNIEIKIDDLTERMSNLELPFPDKLTIPGHNVRILGRNAKFNGLNAPFPNFNRNFPRVNEFFANFLEPGDRALDRLLELATEIDDSMSTMATIPASYPEAYLSPDSFPVADYTWPNTVEHTFTKPKFVLTIKIIHQTLSAAGQVLNDCFDQEVIIGAGGNIALAKGITDGIIGALNIFVEVMDEVNGDIGSAQVAASYERLAHIHTDMETVQDSINSHISDFYEWKELSLRTRIEINLAGHGEHPHPIAIFILPEQFGGYLELARDIVQETINNMLAAGQNVHKAVMYHGRGNDKFAAGEYKKAYHYYGKSYREATKEEDDD